MKRIGISLVAAAAVTMLAPAALPAQDVINPSTQVR